MINVKLYGIYDDEEHLLKAVALLNKKGIKIKEVFTPFPVHGLEKALGLKHTRLSTASFIYGLTGLSLGILMMWYMMIHDWPINIGGKPNFSFADNLTSFIPPLFELTVFCAAHGMVLSFLLASKLAPGMKAVNPFRDTTSDKFAIEVDRDTELSKEEMIEVLNETRIYEVRTKDS